MSTGGRASGAATLFSCAEFPTGLAVRRFTTPPAVSASRTRNPTPHRRPRRFSANGPPDLRLTGLARLLFPNGIRTTEVYGAKRGRRSMEKIDGQRTIQPSISSVGWRSNDAKTTLRSRVSVLALAKTKGGWLFPGTSRLPSLRHRLFAS